MHMPFFLFIASLAAVLVAVFLPGWSDLLLLAVPSAIAAFLLVLRAWALQPASPGQGELGAVVDGSNVMHWLDGTPRIAPVRDVVRDLEARGLRPFVVFDANAGHRLSGRYLHDGALGYELGLGKDQVLVVDKGTPADPAILRLARRSGAVVVTRDRYRDWEADFPEITRPGHLVRGGYRSGWLWLDLEKETVPEAEPAARNRRAKRVG